MNKNILFHCDFMTNNFSENFLLAVSEHFIEETYLS